MQVTQTEAGAPVKLKKGIPETVSSEGLEVGGMVSNESVEPMGPTLPQGRRCASADAKFLGLKG